MEIQVNEYQTTITDELLQQYPDEVREQFMDFITNIEFVRNLISPNRPRAKDLPRDEKGRIIVNLENPHIIEDADYFRLPALHFMKYGCYTFLKPNSNPHSEYRKHWDEEIRRIRDGYVRESDGEWVTGYCYWFLNYCPMLVNLIEKGRKKAIRTESMPFFFEGIYWRFHYLYKAREEGKHAIELARRGAHPYFLKVFTPDGWKEWKDIHIGSKLYAIDGSITTVTDIPYDDVAPYYKITLRDGRVVFASDDHLWKVIQHNHTGELLYNTEELLSCYKKVRLISDRIPSGIEYTCGIPSNLGVNLLYSKTKVDPYTFGLLLGDGCFRHLSCYYTCSDEDFLEIRNYIPYKYTKWKYKCSYRLHIDNWKSILEEYKLYNLKSEDKFIPNEFLINSKEVRLELLRGLMDSDGYNHKSTPELCTTSKKLRDDVLFLARSLGYNCQYVIKKAGYKDKGIYKECLPVYIITIYGGKEVFKLKRKQDKISYNSKRSLSRKIKTIITNIQFMGYYNCKCVTVDSKDSCYLIGDFVTTHNCAKSYSLAAIMSHNLLLGETEESKRRVTTVLTAYEKEYLKDDKDGTLSKFKPEINFLWENTPFPRLTTKNSPNEMSWVMGYKDEYGIEKGSLNMVLGVSAKDNPDKLRGKRGWILFEEMGLFKGLLALYDTTRKSVEEGDYTFALMYLVGCVCAGTKVWTPNGKYINIEDLTKEEGIVGFTPECTVTPSDNCSITLHRGITNEPITSTINVGKKECVSITLCNGNNLRCSKDHPILIQKHRSNHDGSISYYEEVFRNAENLKVGDRVIESRAIPVFGTDTLFDARLVGMLIGDGTYGSSSVGYCSEDKELWDYVESKYKFSIYHLHITKSGKTYKEGHINGISKELVKIGIKGQTKTQKRLPKNYQLLDRENTILLLSGLYDTDGSVYLLKKDWVITLTLSNREILELVQILWRKFGVLCSISKINPRIEEGRKDKNPWYTLTISGRYSSSRASKILQLLVPHKKERLEKIPLYYASHPSRKVQKYPADIIVSKVKSIALIGENTVYNLTAGLSHTYLANNIVTHNTASEDESDFSSAKTLLYSPEGYNIMSIKNVFDKPSQGKPTFGFFFPAYINRLGCYNKDGVSDVVKALLQILMARYKAKYSTDPKSVLRVIAEDPITPAEAIIKVKSAYFPVAALNERLLQLDSNPNSFDDVYVGTLVQVDDKVEFRITGDTPIRLYGVSNDTEGALEIYQMPKRKLDGKVYENRYIIGHDPVDNDLADSNSLSSTFVFDLYTDTIVAEFTGRKSFADDNFEMVRLLCLFYNARCMYESNKKGIFGYFKTMNCTHLLAETPEYLRDMDYIKYNNFGSNRYGIAATAAINSYANSLVRDWLLKPTTVIVKDEDGSEVESTQLMLSTIKSRALLDELVQYQPELNVDRIRALGMVMLYRQEKIVLYQNNLNELALEKIESSYLGKDDFFTRNYDNRLKAAQGGIQSKYVPKITLGNL